MTMAGAGGGTTHRALLYYYKDAPCSAGGCPRPLHHVSGRGQLHGVRGPLGLSVSRHSPSLWDSARDGLRDAVHLDVDH